MPFSLALRRPLVLLPTATVSQSYGGKVKRSQTTQVHHFKLGLEEPNAILRYQRRNERPARGSLDYSQDSLLPDKEPIDFVSDYLTCVRKYVLSSVLPSRYGQKFLEIGTMFNVLTVPDSWSEMANGRLQEAAIRAGI